MQRAIIAMAITYVYQVFTGGDAGPLGLILGFFGGFVAGIYEMFKILFQQGVLYMKSKLHISLIILALSLSLVTCGSIAQVNKTSAKSVSESIITQDMQSTPGTQPANPAILHLGKCAKMRHGTGTTQGAIARF
jgi:hypothetical protein